MTSTAGTGAHIGELKLRRLRAGEALGDEVAAALGRSVPTIRKRLQQFAARGGEELRP